MAAAVETNEAALDALMDRLAAGDRSAFDPLHAALRPRAERVARMRLGDAHADDAVQSALLRVFSRASEFERGRPVLPWFYAIVANEIHAVARKQRLTHEVSERAPDTRRDPEAELAERELHRALERAIAQLDDDAAEAIHAVLDRAPRPEVASPTFRKRVSRAYARLRMLLGVVHVG